MKNSLFIAFFSALILISCGKDKPLTSESNEIITSKDGDLYKVDTLNSKIEWKGYKVVKSDNTSHFGTLKFENGEVTVKDGKLESGTFTADMTSLESVDLKDNAEMKAKLEGHLKNADFFEVSKFPTASFQITKVSEATNKGDYNTIINGNLTLKGITKPVQFYANVAVKDGSVNIATEPTDLNREDFGVKFAIPVQDGILKNEITLQVFIKALQAK